VSAPRILAIVPARGGSKGIRRKNVRLLRGRPLLAHVLLALGRSRFAPAVWVTTDDDEIAEIAARFGARVLRRPAELASDRVTLDPVIHHAAGAIEATLGSRFDVVVTVQPTSPLLSPERFDAAVAAVAFDGYDTAITVVDDRHLRWLGDPEAPRPGFDARKNRQELPAAWRETGAVLAARRDFVQPESRFGPHVRLLPVPEHEAVDIDGYADWWLAENWLARRRLAVRVDGGAGLGLGHVYRQLALASRLFNHEIRFFMDPKGADGIRLAESHGVSIERCPPEEFVQRLDAFRPHVVFLDVLDTDADWVSAVRGPGRFVATFEDLGAGADVADLVLNELYQDARADGARRICGPGVACLREEFYGLSPHPTAPAVSEVLVTFGGTDPGNLTLRALDALERVPADFSLTVVLGLGYAHEDSLAPWAKRTRRPHRILRDARAISAAMARADLAITSAGRTVYELVACGTPALVLAQNERELLHCCAREEFGVVNLGLGRERSPAEIAEAVVGMLPFEAREELHLAMLSVDLWRGPERILRAVFDGLEERERLRTAWRSEVGFDADREEEECGSDVSS
jgi:CMP-N-acetylneuraminic acid synthetase/spore coat polysaccharide biosynthesis predicted glycosyltransferase SpsG